MRSRLVLAAGCAVALAACSAKASAPVDGGPVELDTEIVRAQVLLHEGREKVWVCHRGRWQDVAGPAAAVHIRHGDRVSDEVRERRASC